MIAPYISEKPESIFHFRSKLRRLLIVYCEINDLNVDDILPNDECVGELMSIYRKLFFIDKKQLENKGDLSIDDLFSVIFC